MNFKKYKITLETNEERTDIYYQRAFDKESAVILAQAEAIKSARGHKLISVIQI